MQLFYLLLPISEAETLAEFAVPSQSSLLKISILMAFIASLFPVFSVFIPIIALAGLIFPALLLLFHGNFL